MSSLDEQPFLDNVLTPGSSLHPTFLLILDVAFAGLFVVLFGLIFLTRSYHFVALLLIELALWATIKWVVHELRNTPGSNWPEAQEQETQTETKKDS